MNLKINKKIKLGKKIISENSEPYLIAEISCNHNGSINNAKNLIKLAKKSNADAVKFQTYTPDTITLKSNKKDFKINSGLWKGKTLWDLYNKAQTPFNWFPKLFETAKKNKIDCFSSPFDETAVDLLESLGCPFYKLASFEINHIPLIKKIAKTKKPIIISTGTAKIHEIDNAIRTANVESTTPLKSGILDLEGFTNIVKENPEIGGSVYFEVAKAAVNNLATASADISNLTQAFFFALTR